MNDTDVSKQIQQMVRFIRQEAEEKANEISVSAEEEFNIEKLQLVEAEKKKIRQEYERKQKQVEIRKKIEYSMQLNASRIKVLQAQDDLVNSMKESASKELLRVSQNHRSYGHLLKNLIVQSLLRLKEPSVLLRCRENDVNLVESVLDLAKEEYADKAKVHPPEIIVDRVHLPPAPSHHNAHGPFCSGGVVLASRDGENCVRKHSRCKVGCRVPQKNFLRSAKVCLDKLPDGPDVFIARMILSELKVHKNWALIIVFCLVICFLSVPCTFDVFAFIEVPLHFTLVFLDNLRNLPENESHHHNVDITPQ